MSKTNFDDLDLAVPGIEADEINAESTPVGQVLRADGAGGTIWADGAAILNLYHDTEDQFDSGPWQVITNQYAEVADAGFLHDGPSGEITIGPELDGRALLFFIRSGIWSATQDGTYLAKIERHDGSFWGTLYEARRPVVASADAYTIVSFQEIARAVARRNGAFQSATARQRPAPLSGCSRTVARWWWQFRKRAKGEHHIPRIMSDHQDKVGHHAG